MNYLTYKNITLSKGSQTMSKRVWLHLYETKKTNHSDCRGGWGGEVGEECQEMINWNRARWSEVMEMFCILIMVIISYMGGCMCKHSLNKHNVCFIVCKPNFNKGDLKKTKNTSLRLLQDSVFPQGQELCLFWLNLNLQHLGQCLPYNTIGTH